MTSLVTWPIRPTKLRLVVETVRSPSAITPMCPPRQGPQVGVETAQPAVPDEETGEAEAAPQSVGELFAAFYAEMTGRPLTGEQRAVVAQTLKNLEVEP